MKKIHVTGQIPLQGQVMIQGSKNAALPIMAATILTNGVTMLYNCPRIVDVYQMQKLLNSLGCKSVWEENGLRIDTRELHQGNMPTDAVIGMRSSIILLGPVLSRFGKCVLEHPGGCVIGERPIDMHLESLGSMNVQFFEIEKQIHASTNRICGNEIFLKKSSVGTTENVILAAALARGDTILHGGAKEPEIDALCEFLRGAGASIAEDKEGNIVIHGVEELHGSEYKIEHDRIVAGTYAFACVATHGHVMLEKAPVGQMKAVLDCLKKLGAFYQADEEGLYLEHSGDILPIPYIETACYPDFPTDLQSSLVSVLTKAKGKSLVKETVFSNRFRTLPELRKMGASMIECDGESIYIAGVESLHGRALEAQELRGGAALVIAGLAANGESTIDGCEYIERGYVNICRDFRELGARIYGV